MKTTHEFKDEELKSQVDGIKQTLEVAEPKSREEELNSLEEFILSLPLAVEPENNVSKKQAINAINALKAGTNVEENNKKLKAALSVIAASEGQLLIFTVFHARNKEYAAQLGNDNLIVRSLLGFSEAIANYVRALMTLTMGKMIGQIFPTYKGIKNNLDALDPKDDSWTPVITDEKSAELATHFLKFLLFTSKHTPALPFKEKLSGILSFIYEKIAKELNYEGHDKPFNTQKLLENSMIDITKKRIEAFTGKPFVCDILDNEFASIEDALDFVATRDGAENKEEAKEILMLAQRVASLNHFSHFFSPSVIDVKVEDRLNLLDKLMVAKAHLSRFRPDHQFVDSHIAKEVATQLIDALPGKAKEIEALRDKMLVKTGKDSFRQEAAVKLESLINESIEDQKKQLQGVVDSLTHLSEKLKLAEAKLSTFRPKVRSDMKVADEVMTLLTEALPAQASKISELHERMTVSDSKKYGVRQKASAELNSLIAAQIEVNKKQLEALIKSLDHLSDKLKLSQEKLQKFRPNHPVLDKNIADEVAVLLIEALPDQAQEIIELRNEMKVSDIKATDLRQRAVNKLNGLIEEGLKGLDNKKNDHLSAIDLLNKPVPPMPEVLTLWQRFVAWLKRTFTIKKKEVPAEAIAPNEEVKAPDAVKGSVHGITVSLAKSGKVEVVTMPAAMSDEKKSTPVTVGAKKAKGFFSKKGEDTQSKKAEKENAVEATL